jgi:hypothetical protein
MNNHKVNQGPHWTRVKKYQKYYDVPCTACDAPIGYACVTKAGNRSVEFHRARMNAMRDANELNEVLKDIARPPTPGFHKQGSAGQAAALSRAKAFYPFD